MKTKRNSEVEEYNKLNRKSTRRGSMSALTEKKESVNLKTSPFEIILSDEQNIKE